MKARELERFIKQTVGFGLKTAAVRRIHGNTVTVQVGGSSKYLRAIPVVGGTSGLLVGDSVILTEVDGGIVAQRHVRS